MKARAKKPNILFMIVDDLRPALGCYRRPDMITPNIDKLAASGTVFEKNYCQQPICMASRASIFTGHRPKHSRIYSCLPVKEVIPDAHTMQRHFEQAGYQMIGSGKIYHHAIDNETQYASEYAKNKTPAFGRGYCAESSRQSIERNANYYAANDRGDVQGRGPSHESPDVPDFFYSDGACADWACQRLEALREEDSDQPFFLTLGWAKPHLPFSCPKKYWDLYQRDTLKLPENRFEQERVTEYSRYTFGELRNYENIPQGNERLSDDVALDLMHGYYACVSFLDAQVGKVLDKLEALGLAEDTLVVFTADHAFKLGEHDQWCKHTSFSVDYHVPLIYRVPGTASQGKRVRKLTESIDIYPTLCSLAGVEQPGHLEGADLTHFVESPADTGKEAAFCMWPLDRNSPDRSTSGYTVLTERWRYTEWYHNKTGALKATELVDRINDPDENKNISGLSEYVEIEKKLSELLQQGEGWRDFEAVKKANTI